MEISQKVIGISAALGSAASWALGAILFKKIGDQMSPFGMTLAKGSVSVILLGLVASLVGLVDMDSKTLWLLVLSGIIGIGLGDTLFFQALKDLGPVSLLVLLMLGQVLTVVMAIFILKELPSPVAWGGISLVLVGIGVVLACDLSGEKKKSGLRGILLGLAFMLCMSVSVIIAKPPMDKISGTMQATFIRMLAGTVGIFASGLLLGQVSGWIAPLKKQSFLVYFVISVCIVTFGGFWLSMVAIKNLDVAVANTLNSTEPIFVLPLAALFLKDKIKPWAVAGSITAMSGIALICFYP